MARNNGNGSLNGSGNGHDPEPDEPVSAVTVYQKKPKRPRRHLLTAPRHAAIVEAARAGLSREGAAGAAGIGKRTLFRWLADGREADAKNKAERSRREEGCRQLWHAVTRAEADLERDMLAIVIADAPDNAGSAMWLLERKWPARFGRIRRELTGANGGPIDVRASAAAEVNQFSGLGDDDLLAGYQAALEDAAGGEPGS